MTENLQTSSRPIAVVAHALAPGPGGPEAEVNRHLVERLAERWSAPLLALTAGDDTAHGDSAAMPPGRHTGLQEWSLAADGAPTGGTRMLARLAEQARDRRYSPGRLLSRLFYEHSGYSIKYHAWERALAPVLGQFLDHHPRAAVWSRALPLTSIAAAHRCLRHSKRRHHPWIVNINDPCPPGLRLGLYPIGQRTADKQARTFRRLLAHIDALTFPSSRLHQLHIEAFPALARLPARIIPHATPALDARPSQEPGRELVLGFAGWPRHDVLSEAVAEGIGRFVRAQPDATWALEFHLTRPSTAVESLKKRFPQHVRVKHELTRDGDSIDQHLQSVDTLVLFETAIDEPLLLTKLAGYARFGKPILAIASTRGTTAAVLERFKAGLIAPFEEPAAIERCLSQLWEAWSHGKLGHLSPGPELERAFGPEHALDQLRGLFEDLEQRRQGLQGPDWP